MVALLFSACVGAAAAQGARLPQPRPVPAQENTVPALPDMPPAAGPAPSVQGATTLPRPRPVRAGESGTASPAVVEDAAAPEPAVAAGEGDPAPGTPQSAQAAIDSFAREPRPRPEPPATLALVAPPEIAIPDPDPSLSLPDDSAAAYSACLNRLRRLGVQFTEEARIDPPGGCGVAHPLNVTAIGAGISVTPEAILNCATTEAVAVWARDILVPAAAQQLDAAPNRIVHGSAYVCRPLNNQAGQRLSEHATGNAFDVSAIEFADRDPVTVGNYESRTERRFEDTIRAGSCAYFTTVLGPGSNAAHAVHLHFDLAQRRGGYRLCDMGDARTARRSP